MNKITVVLIILLAIMVGTSIAQINGINIYSEGQTDYNTIIEDTLANLGYWDMNYDTNISYFISQSKTLANCLPIEVNTKGAFRFDTNGTGCPSGIFKINEAELLLKIVSTNNRIDNLGSPSSGVSDGNVFSIGIMNPDTNAFIIDLNAVGDVNMSGLSHPKDTNILYIGTDPFNLACIDNNGTALILRFGGC